MGLDPRRKMRPGPPTPPVMPGGPNTQLNTSVGPSQAAVGKDAERYNALQRRLGRTPTR